jgi:hypothetical protein
MKLETTLETTTPELAKRAAGEKPQERPPAQQKPRRFTVTPRVHLRRNAALATVRSFLRRAHELANFYFVQRWNGFPRPTEPALDLETTQAFIDCLKSSKAYLEFGSGGTTLVADALNIRTLSVESDRFYARVVRRALSPRTTVHVIDVYIGLTVEWSRPLFKTPTSTRLRRWCRYWESPFEHLQTQGWFPDFVLVDGRFRRACTLQTARAALLSDRQVTILVDDYFLDDRKDYRQLENWLGVPDRVGLAAIFAVNAGSCELPSVADVEEAASDFE